MRSGRRLLAPSALLVALLASSCGDRTPREPFVIGYVAPFSSAVDGVYDREALAGVQYEVARLNSLGGLEGRPIDVVVADVGGEPAGAADAATRLVEEGADVLFAAPFPAYVEGVVAVGARDGVPVLSVAGTIPSLVAGSETAFLTAFGDNVQAAAAAEVAVGAGYRTALLVSTSDIPDYGDTLPRYFAAAFTDRGGRVLDQVDVDLATEAAFDEVLAALTALPEPPDLIYTAIYSPWLEDLLAALRSHGYDGPVYGADGAETADLLAAGSLADGVVLTSHAFASTRPTVGVLFSPRSPAERIAQFVEGFERFHDRPPRSLSFAALGADAVGVVHAAAARADGDDPSELSTAIADLDRVEVTTGRTTYRGNGSVPVKVVYVLEVRDGAFRLLDVVEPDDVPEPLG
jgi:branched-chain amino acid transport system substrate-binding protein